MSDTPATPRTNALAATFSLYRNDGADLMTLWKLARSLEVELAAAHRALKPFAIYAEKRIAKPFVGLDDTIHAIHAGTRHHGPNRHDC